MQVEKTKETCQINKAEMTSGAVMGENDDGIGHNWARQI